METEREKEDWQKAKQKCRLTDEEIRKAKMLGLTPAKLLSMIPSRQESWKDPVALRIHRLWDRKEER
ncbi:MAG TPA: hypothetical protein DEP00_04915 [Lachnospiraceae bacterium]|jgi:hypothetical protein|nr:hypothetical protein [Lachnospiraceae bacterium]